MWAALFPGQGSQSVGMGKFLFENFQVARECFEEASDTLKINFKQICFEDPGQVLQLTEYTQPALLLVSTATFRVVQSISRLNIAAGAGHSVGEYSAIVAANVITLADGLRAVRHRGQEMQKAVPVGQGAMAALLGLEDEMVLKLCRWTEASSGFGPLEAANFNSPGQVVISGQSQALNWLREKLKNSEEIQTVLEMEQIPRLKIIPLAVSAPFHCSMMQPAEEAMRIHLQALEFSNADWPVVQNVNARETTSGDEIRDRLIEQISRSVLWTQSVFRLKDLNCTNFIEFGAGKVLSGLSKKIDSEASAPFNINTLDDLKKLELALNEDR